MKMVPFRLITFDVTNTLLKFNRGPGEQYGKIASLYGIHCDEKVLTANFKLLWKTMNEEHPIFGLKSGMGWEHWWKMLVIRTFKETERNLDEGLLGKVALHLIELYKTAACWKEKDGAIEILNYLFDKNIPLGIISNTDPRLHQVLNNTKLNYYFKFVLTSYESEVQKPDPCIFQKAILKAGLQNLKPNECLHVGDTVQLDYLGAKGSGWNSFLIHDKKAKIIQDGSQLIDPSDLFTNLNKLQKYFESNNSSSKILSKVSQIKQSH